MEIRILITLIVDNCLNDEHQKKKKIATTTAVKATRQFKFSSVFFCLSPRRFYGCLLLLFFLAALMAMLPIHHHIWPMMWPSRSNAIARIQLIVNQTAQKEQKDPNTQCITFSIAPKANIFYYICIRNNNKIKA